VTDTTIGRAKRDIKAGEILRFTLRTDGFCQSADIAFRSGLSFLDMHLVNKPTKETGHEDGKCSIWGK
jgi:hypothetical protein